MANIQFLLHPWLASEEREQEFLRKASEICLLHLLPDEYIKCQPVRHLLREILACCCEDICMVLWISDVMQIMYEYEHSRVVTLCLDLSVVTIGV